jgi:hypothetical protein
LLALDFDTETVAAYLNPSATSLGTGTTLSFDPSFALNGVQLAAYNGSSALSNFVIADSASEALAAVPEPSTWAMLLGGLGLLVFVRRFRNSSLVS